MTSSRGSLWRRWDPHIHTPGTVLEDRFGAESWDAYLSAIEAAQPTVEALGITDYLSLDRYEEVRRFHDEGRIPEVKLLFPNVEFRLGIGTEHGSAVNAHLLISPEQPEHVERSKGLLSQLTFRVGGETFRCERADLIRLGRSHAANDLDDEPALAVGTNQFKISIDDLRKLFLENEWARENIIFGVVAGTGDGTSGLAKDASLAALRREVQRLADVVFSGRPADREFWLGRGTDSLEEILNKYRGAKPCLHGSDAHELAKVCKPDSDRRTWIKGDATFESLRQACIEPESRVRVGHAPPDGPLDYQVIREIRLTGAQWFHPTSLALNPGLIGIIGARGSGKTALADLIAVGAGSTEARSNRQSFVSRASEYLSDTQIDLIWDDGEITSHRLGQGREDNEDVDRSRVQYLSQQFVERLCSSEDGITDELLDEIERVVYTRQSAEIRAGATDFADLLEMRLARSRAANVRDREALARAVEQMNIEQMKLAGLPRLEIKHEAVKKAIQEQIAGRAALIGQGTKERTKRLDEIQTELDTRQRHVNTIRSAQQAIAGLKDLVDDLRERQAAAELVDLQERYKAADLKDEDWEAFRRQFVGDVDEILSRRAHESEKQLVQLRGPSTAEEGDGPFVADDAELSKVGLLALEKEAARLRKLIGIDGRKAEQLKELDAKIAQSKQALERETAELEDARRAPDRIAKLRERRKRDYASIFETLITEEHELALLYSPVKHTIDEAGGTLSKLAFVVRREVDLNQWVADGEDLLDLRKAGPFRGHGALDRIARDELLTAWCEGTTQDVTEAIAQFRDGHDAQLLEHSPFRREQSEFWEWAAKVARWLDSTAHISITYGVQYDGVDIEQLSPGTRGIVLLLLYLSLDQSDTRPLIIDQPEENLDPKSVFDELVDRFRETRLRRQVMIVTHNANLVVNTDADQVIIARGGSRPPDALPDIFYEAGGLEALSVRQAVCSILEGGETAFRERARRLRLRLPSQ